MRTAQEIYAEYKIMPSLQRHQLRVAAVANVICGNLTSPVNINDVVTATLVHDMANIIKSDLTYFPEFVEPEGLAYWRQVKDSFIEKYGPDHHAANKKIAETIGLPERVVQLVDGIGYSKLPWIVAGVDIEQKIAEYADTRVGPHGVLPMEERMREGKRRFNAKKTSGQTPYYQDDDFERLVNFGRELERQIFAVATIAPEEITDEAVAPLIEELRKYPIA